MADFCAVCTAVMFGDYPSDFTGWLSARLAELPAGFPFAWALCEGCGWHLLDNAGVTACRNGPDDDPATGCVQCRAILVEAMPLFDAHG